jgi:hypothetical protein
MFKLSDAELLEYIQKRASERESKTSVASTEELINNFSNDQEHQEDDVFNELSYEDKTRKEIKEEKRCRQVQGDMKAVNSFLKATEVAVDDEPKKDFDTPIEVTKALMLLGFSNWSSLESGKLIY